MQNIEIEEKEPFRITDNSQLDWAFSKLAELKAEDDELRERAEVQYQKIKEWEDRERGKKNEEMNYFEELIQDYHFRVLLENPKAKTLSTPFGKSKSRRSGAQPEQADKEALLQHIQANDLRDYIKEDVKWGDFKKSLKIQEVDGVPVVFDENGQAVPGVVVKPETVSYSVEIE